VATVTVHFIGDTLHLTNVETRRVECSGCVRDAVALAFPELHPARMVYVRGVHEVQGDARVQDGDEIRVGYRPAGIEITWAVVAKIVITALVSAAVSYLVGYLMRPKQRNKFSSPAYSVNIEQNAARLGGTVPVIYGRVLALPDIASQPYSEFVNNNERVSMILCLGMGEFIVSDIFVGESRISDYPAGSIAAYIYPPGAHQQKLGVIEEETGVIEDCFTVPESTGVELSAPNDPTEISVTGTASGGVLRPNDPTAATYWIGLVPGQKYVVTTSAGGRAILTYVGVGPDGSAQFDGPLPPTPPPVTRNAVANLTAAQDAKEGAVMKMVFSDPAAAAQVQHQLTVKYLNVTRGPYQIYKTTGVPDGGAGLLAAPRLPDDPGEKPPSGAPTLWLRTHGSGFISANNTPIDPAATVAITSYSETIYYLTPYVEGSTPTEADPYRWRGWYALCRPGEQVNALWFDLEMPGGIAWITDGGDYQPIQVNWLVQVQPIDDDSSPTGAVIEYTPGIAGATSNPLRRTWGFALPTGRYRARVARINPRDQRASKEISGSRMAGLRARIAHTYGTPAYEACTLLVMRFTATAGLSAAAGRRIKVDCTRRLPDISTGALLATANPAEAFADVLENADYGAARPTTETDRAQLLKLRPQWDTVNGFNAVFDQPITVVDALQSVLGPVRAMPMPIGSFMSVVQDAPRTRDYVFSPETIVAGTLTIGYNFDGTDEPDHLEVIYTDPDSMADARVYYPSKGARPEVVEIFGCTSPTHATAWAKLTWQERQYNRKTVQFELEGEGYLINPLTRFGVAVPNVDWGSGGVVLQWDAVSKEVQLDTPYPQGVNTIYFKSEATGKLLAPSTITARISDYHLRLAAAPAEEIHGSDETGDATRWVSTGDDRLFFEFNVTDLEPTGPMRVKVTGTQYTAEKYAGTFVSNWVT